MAAPAKVVPSQAGLLALDRLVDDLPGADVVRGSMFGMPCLKRRGGKTFVGLFGHDMVFKLSGEAHASALALQGSRLFDPMGGRPMKQWVQVEPEHEDRWAELAAAALVDLDG